MVSKPELHNATCSSCGDNYSDHNSRIAGNNTLGKYVENKNCSGCQTAKQKSGNYKMDKYTWRSLKEINASWGNVKQGELWEKALQKFALSLPVDEELQQKFVEAMR